MTAAPLPHERLMTADNDVFRSLRAAELSLHGAVYLGPALGAAVWQNDLRHDTRYDAPRHHTLSCYLRGGERVRRRMGQTVLQGGAPGKLCVMPAGHESDWEVADELRFFHFYFSQEKLRQQAERILDGDCPALALRDLTFIEDPWLSGLCRRMLALDWRECADHLALSAIGERVIEHLLRRHASGMKLLPAVTGGLAPSVLRRVLEHIDAHLDTPLPLPELSAVAGLSTFHFARMFRNAMGRSPHAYVTDRRLDHARRLIVASRLPFAEIALACGFSSQSHLSRLVAARFGAAPGVLRRSA